MDLGITTFFFLFLNCFLLLLGTIRIIIAILLAIMSVFVFSHLKEVTFSPFIGDAVLTGMNEEAIFILGILAGNKNNVRFLNAYEFFILMLVVSKVLSLNEINRNEERLKEDISFSLGDLMNDCRIKNLQTSKVDDIQRSFRCCGLENPNFWLKGNNSISPLPKSCCPVTTSDSCTLAHSYTEGCLNQMYSKLPYLLLNIHYYTLFPIIEVIVFMVGILLIIMVLKTAANSLA